MGAFGAAWSWPAWQGTGVGWHHHQHHHQRQRRWKLNATNARQLRVCHKPRKFCAFEIASTRLPQRPPTRSLPASPAIHSDDLETHARTLRCHAHGSLDSQRSCCYPPFDLCQTQPALDYSNAGSLQDAVSGSSSARPCGAKIKGGGGSGGGGYDVYAGVVSVLVLVISVRARVCGGNQAA